MSSNRARRRRRTQTTASVTKSRFIALSLAGTLLLAATFRGAYAAPIRPTYGTGGGQGTGSSDNGGGLSDAEIAGIAAGGVVVGGAIWWFAAGGKDSHHDNRHSASATSTDPGAAEDVAAIRLVGADEVQAGDVAVYRLEVKSSAGEWRTVTEDENASLEVSKSALMPMDGAKNAFALPITCSRSADGQVARITGSFHSAGGPVWTTSKQVKLVVPQQLGS